MRLVLVLAGLLTAGSRPATRGAPPNVPVILVDDLRWRGLGADGQTRRRARPS